MRSLDFTSNNPGVLSYNSPWVSHSGWDSEANVVCGQQAVSRGHSKGETCALQCEEDFTI